METLWNTVLNLDSSGLGTEPVATAAVLVVDALFFYVAVFTFGFARIVRRPSYMGAPPLQRILFRALIFAYAAFRASTVFASTVSDSGLAGAPTYAFRGVMDASHEGDAVVDRLLTLGVYFISPIFLLFLGALQSYTTRLERVALAPAVQPALRNAYRTMYGSASRTTFAYSFLALLILLANTYARAVYAHHRVLLVAVVVAFQLIGLLWRFSSLNSLKTSGWHFWAKGSADISDDDLATLRSAWEHAWALTGLRIVAPLAAVLFSGWGFPPILVSLLFWGVDVGVEWVYARTP